MGAAGRGGLVLVPVLPQEKAGIAAGAAPPLESHCKLLIQPLLKTLRPVGLLLHNAGAPLLNITVHFKLILNIN